MQAKTGSGLTYMPAAKFREEMNCSKFFEQTLVQAGKLTRKKIGRKTFYRVSEINALFEQQA